MKAIKLCFISLLMISRCAISAQVVISTDGSAADSSAILDVKSSDKGVLLPRMTSYQMARISDPANGLTVFNTSESKFYKYSLADSLWKEIAFGTGVINPKPCIIGSGDACINTVAEGNFMIGIALSVSETVTFEVIAINAVDYYITTDTVNGYSFSGSGTFANTGTQTVTLYGSGEPIAVQTDNFTATADQNGGTCAFSVEVVPWGCGFPFIDSRDNQEYNTVLINDLCWLAENLNTGTRIDATVAQSQNTPTEIIEKYCYDNLEANCDIYGGLYRWDEMMQYTTTDGVQGICMDGWHLPTDAEWTALTDYLGGLSVAGGAMKETGTEHWRDPNVGATNSSGFTGLPGGSNDGSHLFYELEYAAYWWTSSEFSSANGWLLGGLHHLNTLAYRLNEEKIYSLSVRCIMD